MGYRFNRIFGSSVSKRGAAIAILAGVFGLAVVPRYARAQRVLTVVAHDDTLEVAPSVPAGLLTVRLVLKGKARRDLVVHRIPVGTTPEEVVRGAVGRPERWFQRWSFGGPAVPRDSVVDANATIELRPGRYALVSYEVDRIGRPKGQGYLWNEVTAIAASVLIASRFAVPDVRIRIKDASVEVLGTMRPGQRVLQVENVGARPHEMLVGRLKPGKTLADAKRWGRDGGEMPFVYVGGLTPMSPGMTAQTRLVLQSGVHVVLCPMQSDHAKGVVTSFRVG